MNSNSIPINVDAGQLNDDLRDRSSSRVSIIHRRSFNSQ